MILSFLRQILWCKKGEEMKKITAIICVFILLLSPVTVFAAAEINQEKDDNKDSVGTIPSTKTVKEGSSTAEPESVPASSSSTKSTTNKSTSAGTSNKTSAGPGLSD